MAERTRAPARSKRITRKTPRSAASKQKAPAPSFKQPGQSRRRLSSPSAPDESSGMGIGRGPAMPPAVGTIERLHRAVVEELAAVEALRTQLKQKPQSRLDAERIARTLSSLTETLQKLQRLECTVPQTGPYDDDIPADIDEFRRELARRIDAFVASRAEPGDGGRAGA